MRGAPGLSGSGGLGGGAPCGGGLWLLSVWTAPIGGLSLPESSVPCHVFTDSYCVGVWIRVCVYVCVGWAAVHACICCCGWEGTGFMPI